MFQLVKKAVQLQFEKLNEGSLFYVAIDRDKIFEEYLAGFSEEERQGHNCNCCKSFLRQYGGIVSIIDGKRVTLWEAIEVPEEYMASIDNLSRYIHSLPITDVFMTDSIDCGTDINRDTKRNVNWEHFYLEVSNRYTSGNVDSVLGHRRTTKEMLERNLTELSVEATETVLDLIAQDSLYRGKEFEATLKALKALQDDFVGVEDKENFYWAKSVELPESVTRIRNTSIGTLLVDLSEGLDLDAAVTKFEKVVAPGNYKRPTSLISPRMVEDAKAKLTELGLVNSLERRFANETDLNVEDILFTDKSSALTDVFDEMAKETIVNPKTFSKVEEISIQDFIEKVVPTVKSIEALVENTHLPNMVSLLTAVDAEAPSLFKWDNPFSWSYTGGITDSIKERVKNAGGKVDGELRISLSWFNFDDLDLHVVEPNGNHIDWTNKSGKLDVDMNAGSGNTRTAVENVIFTNNASEGRYKVFVHNYTKRETIDTGFEVEVESKGEVFNFGFDKSPANDGRTYLAEFDYSKANGVTFVGESKSQVVSKEKWGVKTNQFVKVKKMMLSPNFWGKNTGNRHFLFFLENAIADEAPRPFFNEFLKDALIENRKVFEVMASKLKVEPTNNQLSGIGFSDTQRNHLLVRVDGNFKRVLKVKF